MVILTDDQQNPKSQPTRQNILQAMHWLVKGAEPNDSLFFHYSGRLIPPTLRNDELTLIFPQVTEDRLRIWTGTKMTVSNSHSLNGIIF